MVLSPNLNSCTKIAAYCFLQIHLEKLKLGLWEKDSFFIFEGQGCTVSVSTEK